MTSREPDLSSYMIPSTSVGIKRKEWLDTPQAAAARNKTSVNAEAREALAQDREGSTGTAQSGSQAKKRKGNHDRSSRERSVGPSGSAGAFSSGTRAPPAVYSELSGLGNKTTSQAIGLYEYLKRHRTQTSLIEIENQAKLGNPHFVFTEDIYNYLITLEGIVESTSKNGQIRFLQYVPLVDLSTPAKLSNYIRQHSTKKGVPLRTIREEYLGDMVKTLNEWEAQGKILIMRAPGNTPLPDPGARPKKNVLAKGSDAAAPGLMEAGARNWRTVYWDYVRERGEAPAGKLDPDLTQMWADTKVEWDADLEKLLASMGHEISPQEAAKKTAKKMFKKKKRPAHRAINKLTNTHLLAHGIDLSRDYVPD